MQRIIEPLAKFYHALRGNRMGEVGAILMLSLLLIALFAPMLAPYDPHESHMTDMGLTMKNEAPSAAHPLGTTLYGHDVLSQTLIGARTAILVGFLTATIVVIIGTTIGVLAGYFGGYVDDILMRFTDVVYGIPTLPFALVTLTILDQSIYFIIMVIALLYWRNSARIIRGEVLSLKEQEFIQKAQTTGASNLRILTKQVLPNILPISLLYFALATGWAIIMAASIAFLGFGDPLRISWGRMIFSAWANNSVSQQPFWVLGPSIMIVLTVMSVYFIGQTYEEVANPRIKER